MQSSGPKRPRNNHTAFSGRRLRAGLAIVAAAWVVAPVNCALGAEANAATATNSSANQQSTHQLSTNQVIAPADPVLSLMLEKGMITEDEAVKVQAAVDARRTNLAAAMAAEYMEPESKWKIGKNIKDIELFGDLRLRYEERQETAPEVVTVKGKKITDSQGKIIDNRERYALRLGLRGDTLDDFYYGFRLETSSNPRSTWVTMGSSSPDPYGKSGSTVEIGQVYLGWSQWSWLDLTAGKMPNPLYTSSLVWSPSINPEGLAEHLKYTVGQLDVFANFAQFLYQDENPNEATPNLGVNGLVGQSTENIFQVAWQGGFVYHVQTNLSVKAGATLYQYFNLVPSTLKAGGQSPYFGDNYVGEGQYAGLTSPFPYNGASGFGTGGILPGYMSANYPNNQVGLDHLEVLEIPFEVNYKIIGLNLRAYGDVAYNLDGRERAQAAADGYRAYLKNVGGNLKLAFPVQGDDVKAFQFGLALGNKDSLGMVNGSAAKKHAWEVRGYWQHVEQYSLDPNLLDLDYFAGAENLQGFFAAAAYGFSDNFIGTIRYGHANRINEKLGTGGTGTDIQQINPINSLDLFQADLTFKF